MLKSVISAPPGGIAGYKFALKFTKATFADGLAGIFHELEIEMEIVE